jgi:NAD(P)-dependent dehydrogenase (short-subunit alcohol dehydrogenase family)
MKKGITPLSPDEVYLNRFKDKVLLVTGAASGSIGGTAAIRAAKEGAKVVCVDLKKK